MVTVPFKNAWVVLPPLRKVSLSTLYVVFITFSGMQFIVADRERMKCILANIKLFVIRESHSEVQTECRGLLNTSSMTFEVKRKLC